MPQKDPLFELIKSLSASEKRYFKRFSKLQGESENEYLDLFHKIEKQKVYDESSLIRQLKNPIFAKNISSGKHYLYQLILKSLRSYHAERKAIFQVDDLLKDIYILMEKNLVAQANKRLKKAKKIAEKYQLNIPKLELLLLERNLIRSFQQKQSSTLINANHLSSEKCMEQINAQVDMVSLYDNVYLTIRNKMQLQDPDGTIKQLLENFSTKAAIQTLSFDSKMTYHLLWSNYYLTIKHDINNALLHLKYILDLFDDFPQFVNEYTNRYISVINNYLNLLALQKNYQPFPQFIQRLEVILPNSEYLKIKIFQSTCSLKLIAYLGQRNFKDALSNLPTIIKTYTAFEKKLHVSFQLEIQQNIALIFFHTQHYDQALEWCNRILYHKKQDIRQDIQSLAKGLQLILHYELGNHELAQSLARALMRAFPNNNEDSINKILGKSVLKVLQQPKKEQAGIWQQLRLDLKTCDAQTNGLEELEYWLEQK